MHIQLQLNLAVYEEETGFYEVVSPLWQNQ